MEPDADTAVHMVVGTFLEGEVRAWAETSEVMVHDGSGSNKSGLESWRLLKHTFDRSSAFSAITVLEIITGMPAAKNIQEVMSKMTTLDRAHQEYTKQAAASRDPEFLRMNSNGIHLCPDVFKKAGLIKIPPDGITKYLKTKPTNLDFERDTYSDLRDFVVTTIHNHSNATCPWTSSGIS